MPEIKLEQGATHLSVKLTIDLKATCMARKAFLDSEKSLKIAAELLKVALPDQVDELQKNLADATLSHAQATHTKDVEASLEYDIADGMSAICWEDIKQILSKQCNPDNPLEAQLGSSLLKSNSPFVIISLDGNFAELVKNSVAAIKRQYVKKALSPTMLEMDIEFKFEAGHVELIINDNAGGFPDEEVEKFNHLVETKQYRECYRFSEPHKDELKDKALKDDRSSVGGERRGLLMLTNLLLDGVLMVGHGKSRQAYIVPEGLTNIRIKNNPLTNGATIILTSPINPCVECPIGIEREDDMLKERCYSSQSEGTNSPLLFQMPPLSPRKKKAAGLLSATSSPSSSKSASPMHFPKERPPSSPLVVVKPEPEDDEPLTFLSI